MYFYSSTSWMTFNRTSKRKRGFVVDGLSEKSITARCFRRDFFCQYFNLPAWFMSLNPIFSCMNAPCLLALHCNLCSTTACWLSSLGVEIKLTDINSIPRGTRLVESILKLFWQPNKQKKPKQNTLIPRIPSLDLANADLQKELFTILHVNPWKMVKFLHIEEKKWWLCWQSPW